MSLVEARERVERWNTLLSLSETVWPDRELMRAEAQVLEMAIPLLKVQREKSLDLVLSNKVFKLIVLTFANVALVINSSYPLSRESSLLIGTALVLEVILVYDLISFCYQSSCFASLGKQIEEEISYSYSAGEPLETDRVKYWRFCIEYELPFAPAKAESLTFLPI